MKRFTDTVMDILTHILYEVYFLHTALEEEINSHETVHIENNTLYILRPHYFACSDICRK